VYTNKQKKGCCKSRIIIFDLWLDAFNCVHIRITYTCIGELVYPGSVAMFIQNYFFLCRRERELQNSNPINICLYLKIVSFFSDQM